MQTDKPRLNLSGDDLSRLAKALSAYKTELKQCLLSKDIAEYARVEINEVIELEQRLHLEEWNHAN